MVGSRVIRVRPSQHDLAPVRDAEPGDRKAHGDPIRSEVAVEGARRAAGDRTREIQGGDSHAGRLELRERTGDCRTAYQIRERDRLCRGGAVAPLLSRVRHVERRNRGAGVVLQAYSPEHVADRRIARSERTERSIRGGTRAVAVQIAGVAAAVVGDDRRAGSGPRVEPARQRGVVRPRRRPARREGIEILGIRRPRASSGSPVQKQEKPSRESEGGRGRGEASAGIGRSSVNLC